MQALKGNESRLKVSEFKLGTLLEITNAINNNLSEHELFVLFQYIIEQQLGIGKAVVFLKQGNAWSPVLRFGTLENELKVDVERDLSHIHDITVMEMAGNASSSFDVVIPVYHQSAKIAYLLLGDMDEDERRASPIIKHLPFIQTLANLTAVAVENKRLVRESLRQERLKRELEMAVEMQSLLLPSVLPMDETLQVAALYKPHNEVGGDYYDVITTSSEEVVICMADVSGKGISAALLMANFQAHLRASVQAGRSIEEIVHLLNAQVWNSAQGERFITAFLAKYNRRTRKLHYVNAAHPSPLLWHGSKCEALAQGSVGLGMLDEIPFVRSGKIEVEPGTFLVCYTDGLDELENEKGRSFDLEMLHKTVADSEAKSPAQLNEAIMKALDMHRGSLDFSDDIALISCFFL